MYLLVKPAFLLTSCWAISLATGKNACAVFRTAWPSSSLSVVTLFRAGCQSEENPIRRAQTLAAEDAADALFPRRPTLVWMLYCDIELSVREAGVIRRKRTNQSIQEGTFSWICDKIGVQICKFRGNVAEGVLNITGRSFGHGYGDGSTNEREGDSEVGNEAHLVD